ncbi:hypothetical protein ACFONN_04305 [Dyella humi]|uniref:J domain-containing protein n=1 Tax=Dyella humi TaxID=1770547 RepID=A0ABW8IGP7_9GAMM
MNWAFELLGLRPDAEVADVKRAYARMLRTTRPDDDPEAFQRLHAAYKMVLAQVNARSPASPTLPVTTETQEAIESLSASKSTSQPSSQTIFAQSSVTMVAAPPVNLDALTNEVIRAAAEAKNGDNLSLWLHARQEFWSIQIKQQAGHRVLNHLFQQPQAMSAECMDALLRFFDLDHVLSGVNPVAVQALRTRQRTLWEIRPGNHRELAQRIGMTWKSYPDVTSLGKDIALLQKPRTWLRALGVALQFGRVREVGHLVHTLLGQGSFDELPPSIDREHAFFWYRAAASGLTMTTQRFIIGSLRSVLAALVCALGLFGILMMDSMGRPLTEEEWISTISTSASAGAIIFALWPLFACFAWFDQWQGQPESAPSRKPWLRRLSIPGLSAFGFMLYETGAMAFAGWVVALSFILAVRKFRRRTIKASKASIRIGSMMPALFFIAIPVLRALSQMHDIGDFPFVPAATITTFGIVIADLWRYRAYLHPKLARN